MASKKRAPRTTDPASSTISTSAPWTLGDELVERIGRRGDGGGERDRAGGGREQPRPAAPFRHGEKHDAGREAHRREAAA